MARAIPLSLDDSASIHRLGQYRAWRLSRSGPADMVWISKADADRPAAHRVLPHGEPSIAIRRRRDQRDEVNAVDLTICGPFHKPMWYRPARREELIAVRLAPESAAEIFGVSPLEFADCPPAEAPRALQQVCAHALHVAETESEANIARALFADLHDYAAPRLAAQRPEMAAAAMLRRASGRVACRKVAEHLQVSERHLRRRFRDRLGCSPKTYARQLRLTFAALKAEEEAQPDWAQLAIAAGFHDQAHMINEFRALISMTPTALHAERRRLSGFYNPDPPAGAKASP